MITLLQFNSLKLVNTISEAEFGKRNHSRNPLISAYFSGQTTQKTEEKISEILVVNPKASRSEIAEALGDITEAGIRYQLNKLKKQRKQNE